MGNHLIILLLILHEKVLLDGNYKYDGEYKSLFQLGKHF